MSATDTLCPIHIRPMTLEDLPGVIQLDRQAFSLPWPERSFRFELEKNEVSRCWVAETAPAESESELSGMIVVWLIVDEVHIATLAVSPGCRRQKVAQRLLAHTLIDAYHAGGSRSYLEVRRGNLPAITLYRRFGYREVGTRKNYYKDNGEDAVLMDLAVIDPEKLKTFL